MGANMSSMIRSAVRTLAALAVWALFAVPAGLAQSGPAGYWPMDEGVGSVADECSGAGLSSEGVIAGQAVWETTDKGRGLRFDGTNTTVKIPGSAAWDFGAGELTVALWVKTDVHATGFVLDHYFGGVPGVWGMVAQDGAPVFAVYDNAAKHASVGFPGFVPGAWQHVAVVWNRATNGWLRAYLNGKPVALTEAVSCDVKHPAELFLGSRQGTDQFCPGYFRDLAIFSRALPEREIAQVASRGVQVATPVVVSALRTDKVLYGPKEAGAVTLRIKNLTATNQVADLAVTVVSALARSRELTRCEVQIPAQGFKELKVPLTFDGEDYGCEVRALVTRGKTTLAEKRECFAVSDDFWKVGIGSDWGQGLHTGRGLQKPIAAQARKLYSNYIELFFWSPCDWALHVGPAKQWWSGQASYPEDEDNLKELIALCHGQGVRTVFYASCNPAGPFGWEAARRHPEWFGGGAFGGNANYDAEALDMWNDPAWRQTHPGNPGWFSLGVDLRRSDAVDYGIDRIRDGIRHYGWDGVRFDGHYTILGNDEMSTRNMRRLKERVWKEFPDFRFGFNYGRAPEWQNGITHEIREGMAGGGMYLQEGISNWRYTGQSYESWRHYATNELRIAKALQALGGTYHCMWRNESQTPPAEAVYKLVYGLIAGGHPVLSSAYDQTPGCGDWGAFMTRWSAFLWAQDLQGVANPREGIDVESARPLFWEPLVQERVVDVRRKFVVVHLVNPCPSDRIAESAMPSPVEKVTVRLKTRFGESVERAVVVRPETTPFDTALDLGGGLGGATVVVPKVSAWAMVVFEVKGRFPLPAAPPLFTEAPKAATAMAETGELTARIVDPNKPPVDLTLKPNEQIWETDSGYSGVPRSVETLPDATGGLAQFKTYSIVALGHSSGFMGRTWLGPLPPGKYRLGFRVKWIDPAPAAESHAWRAHAYVDVTNRETAVDVLTPNCWGDGGGRFKAWLGGVPLERYRRLPPVGEWAYVPIEFDKKDAGYINACLIVDTDRAGDQKLYLDHIKTELLEPYSDAMVAQWHPMAKPTGLRAPEGVDPKKVLVVRGLFWRLYGKGLTDGDGSRDGTYRLPETHRELYKYDAVVLCNVNVANATPEARKACRDWVEDGGRLIVLGGPQALGQGGMPNTFFEEILPVSLAGPAEVVRCDPPLAMGRARGKAEADQPMIFWRHKMQPRDQARVLAWAGEEPLAVMQPSGKGTVSVFLGTLMGEAAPNQKAFWETESWTRLLTDMLTGHQ